MNKTTNRVFVLSSTLKPLMPCHPARARELLNKGRAAVYRMQPFTIILKDREDGITQSTQLKIDPGSKTTGLALVGLFKHRGYTLIWGANLHHRGHLIHLRLLKRSSIRRSRRNRKCRYRPARFNNRIISANSGARWLPPSIKSRVDNVVNWSKKLSKLIQYQHIMYEQVRFDIQKLINPEIHGTEYQKGTLYGFEIREYLLLKFNYQCVYCDAKNGRLEIDHFYPRSKGGTDKISNLVLACRICNQLKSNTLPEVFLVNDSTRLSKIKRLAKSTYRDAAAVNSARFALGIELEQLGKIVSHSTGGQTKYNRVMNGYAKDHYIDAACIGGPDWSVPYIHANYQPLQITAMGRGQRNVVKTDKYGFPRINKNGSRIKAGRIKRILGFQTGDIVNINIPTGKYVGHYQTNLTGIRFNSQFDFNHNSKIISTNYKYIQLIQYTDGYNYNFNITLTSKNYRDVTNSIVMV